MVATTTSAVAEFFPTPASVIAQLIAPVADRLRASTILEPSAGKGDILDYLTETHRVSKKNVYAIEANPELQYVLAGKGYQVLDSDFLAFQEPYQFDVIIMNPPFSKGVDHVLKAWEIVAAGGAVCALLNAETLRNQHTEKRRLLGWLVEQHGQSDPLGQAFRGAARATNVDVVRVVLRKPESERLGILDDTTFDTDAPEREAEFNASPLAQRNLILALVRQYEAVVQLVRQRHELGQQIAFHLKPFSSIAADRYSSSINEELAGIKRWFWDFVFERTKLGNAPTSKFREEFGQLQTSQASMAFTEENVLAVLDLLMTNYASIIQRCIVDVFDKVTGLHEKNRVHTEGWKTNKSWRVNRKIIVPWGVGYDRWGWSFQRYSGDFYADLDRACCFLTGQDFEALRVQSLQTGGPYRTIEAAICAHIYGKTGAYWADPFESEFFTIKVHKKGTVHLTFKDESLWQRFNQEAARGKQWVGPGY